MTEWIELLARTNMPRVRKAVAGFLLDLSCPPWKFDVLWETWPELAISTADHEPLAQQLISGTSQALIAAGSTVYDDITLLSDVVGDSRTQRQAARADARCAYLCMRPLVSRTAIDAPPLPPQRLSEQQLVERVACALVANPEASPGEVARMLREAGARYVRRGRNDANAFCRQMAALVDELAKPAIRETLPDLLRQTAYVLYFTSEDSVLAQEVALQWQGVFGEDFARTLAAANAGDRDAREAIAAMAEFFDRLRPLRWLAETRPGIASAATITTFMRRQNGRVPSYSFVFFSTAWIEACQECVMLLQREWRGTPKIPRDALRDLLDIFVEIAHHVRK